MRGALVAAATRIQPWVAAFLAAWVVGMSGDMLATILAASTGFLGGIVGVLAATPESRLLPAGEDEDGEVPALPPSPAGGPPPRPLPEPYRGRFQTLHKQVEELLATFPKTGSRYLDRTALVGAPERFRGLAKQLVACHPEDPGRPALEARLDRIEEHVERLRLHWTALATLAEDDGGLEAELEATADDLDALIELQREIDGG